MRQGSQSNAISFVPVQTCCLDIALGVLLKEDIMLSTTGEDRRPTAAGA